MLLCHNNLLKRTVLHYSQTLSSAGFKGSESTDLSSSAGVAHGRVVLSVQLGGVVIEVQRLYRNRYSGDLVGAV